MSEFFSLLIVTAFLLVPYDFANESHRLVGGNNCSAGKYHFSISLIEENSKRHFCGGSLIRLNFVLTAAHCLIYYETQPEQVAAVLGNIEKSVYSIQTKSASAIYIHGNFNPKTLVNDIALVLLVSFFELIPSNVLMKLPNKEIQEDLTEFCQKGTVFDWADRGQGLLGRITSAFKVNPVLRCLELPLITRNSCALLNGGVLDQSLICAIGERKNECHGDSGGPFLCDDVQYGIVSTGYDCALGNEPGYYTRLDIYLGFINYVTQNFPHAKLSISKRNGMSSFNVRYHQLLIMFTLCLNVILEMNKC